MTFGEQNTFEDACEQLNFATENGINFLDAAEMCVQCLYAMEDTWALLTTMFDQI